MFIRDWTKVGVHSLVGFVFISKKCNPVLYSANPKYGPGQCTLSWSAFNKAGLKFGSKKLWWWSCSLLVGLTLGFLQTTPQSHALPRIHPSFQPEYSRDSAMSPQFLPPQEHSALRAVLSTPDRVGTPASPVTFLPRRAG